MHFRDKPAPEPRAYPEGTLEGCLREMLREMLREVVREEIAAHRAEPAPEGGGEYVPVHVAAGVVGVDPATIRRWQKSGAIGRYKAGRENRVKLSELHAYLARDARPDESPDVDALARRILADGRLDRRRGG